MTMHQVVILLALVWTGAATSAPPNIVLIVADDLGWNDVPWHNPRIIAPNLLRLAREGVILEQNYALPLCTPTRAALMTGRYPYRFGVQNGVFWSLAPQGLPLELPFLADQLRQRGYSTHALGKWHLGHCKWEFTPTFRGFDSFRGLYLGAGHYYKHSESVAPTPEHYDFRANDRMDLDSLKRYRYRANTGLNRSARGNVQKRARGYDFRSGTAVDWDARGRYSTTLLGKEAAKVLRQSSGRQRPVFLYLAFQAPHFPLQVPAKYEELYPDIKDVWRRRYCGMVSAMDDAVRILERELVKRGLWNNTVLIFTSDNGGQVLAGGNNWPLRGNKNTLWEGGTRVPAFVASPLLKSPSCTSQSMVHVVDWFPTLLGLAGGDPAPGGLDGVDQWKTISECGPSVRNSFVYNLLDRTPMTGAIREGDYKLLHGSGGRLDGWYPEQLGGANISTPDPKTKVTRLLFNLRDDPYERHDLSAQEPELTARLDRLLMEKAATMVPSIMKRDDPRGHPRRWNGTYSPGWC